MKYIYSVTVYSCKQGYFAKWQHLVKNSYGWTFTTQPTPSYIDDDGGSDDDGGGDDMVMMMMMTATPWREAAE